MPSKPADKTFQELVRMMTNHQDPKPNSIAEIFRFNIGDQKLEESIAEYIVELRRLAEHCNHGKILHGMLRDRSVCRLKNDRRQHLLSEGNTLTLEKAIDIAQAMESGIKQSSLILSTQGVEEQP